MEKHNKPDYRKIYSDIITKKFPEKMNECETLLKKQDLRVSDILELNRRIFGSRDKETERFNQRHRSYSRKDIMEILDYQKKHSLNGIQLANHFKISRNTVTNWKKRFLN